MPLTTIIYRGRNRETKFKITAMENSLKAYSSEIALRTLLIKALMFKTDLKEFFEWSGGWKTPIYTDQRLHLGYPESVELILGALKLKVASLGIKFDGILGTKTSGIPWAILLGDALKLPVIVTTPFPGKAFTFDYPTEIPQDEGCDLIASSSPLGIPLGIRTAYTRKKGFVYVRNKKMHGISSKVVGAYTEGQSVCYLNQEGPSGNPTLDMISLNRSGLSVIHGHDDNYTTRVIDINGMNLLTVEDTVSSGKSCVAEIIHARNRGAFINTALAIFSYEFLLANEIFRQEDILYYDLFSYSDLMNPAREQGYISEADAKIVNEWYWEPIAWSNKYGGTKFVEQ